jgi:hypothetical protein
MPVPLATQSNEAPNQPLHELERRSEVSNTQIVVVELLLMRVTCMIEGYRQICWWTQDVEVCFLFSRYYVIF